MAAQKGQPPAYHRVLHSLGQRFERIAVAGRMIDTPRAAQHNKSAHQSTTLERPHSP